MANIWIINPYEPLPHEGTVRLRYSHLCEELAARGHSVSWWSVDWAHDRKVKREAVSGNTAYRVRQLRVPEYRKNVSLARLRSHQAYAHKFLEEGKKSLQSGEVPDLIVFSVPPMETGKAVLEIGKLCGAKVVLDLMDAWPETLVQTMGRNPLTRSITRLLVRPYEHLMRRYCRESDAVCAQSHTFAQFAREKGAEAEVAVFYLGAKPIEEDSKTAGVDPLAFAYIGSMGKVYDLRTLVEAGIQMSASEPDFRLILIGDGEQREMLEHRVKAAACEHTIRFLGYLQGDPYERALTGAKVGVIAMHPSSNVAIPYKAAEYLSRGMFVLNSLPGELQGHLDCAGCGLAYTAGDVRSLMSGMHSVLQHNKEERLKISRSARELFDTYFNRIQISKVYAEWLEQLI